VVFFNYTTMQMTAKIVYYGPGLCGKTTNLQAIHQKTAPQSRGEMVSLETETDRTLFFDLLPLDVGVIGGMKVRLQLYTVPGQVFYNATRKLVLKGVDGIVFVADSQAAALDTNVESLNNLGANLAELGTALDQVPVVFQYNKRDLRNILPVDQLTQTLNGVGAPYFEAAALHGIGVFETLKTISRLAIGSVRKRLADDNRAKPTAPPATPPVTAASAAPSGTPPPTHALADLVPDPPAEDLALEFAEEDTDKHEVRAVATKGKVDIQQELEKLRAIAASPSPRHAVPRASREVERRLQDLLVPGQGARQEIRRKASVEVPAALLKSASALKIHLGLEGDDGEEAVPEAVTVKLAGNRLERLTLHLDLEVKGKP
jgi:signal recognition particle receptor subunit beta